MELTSTNDLPEELLLIIFLLQPMKTLVILRTVCKSWNRIISSEYFFQLFLYKQRTSENTNNYFLLRHPCRLICLLDGETALMYRDILVRSYECYGICDRLFCLSTKDCSKINSEIILWNPVFSKKLPPLEIKYSKHTLLLFGYHDDDYKVLKFVFLKRRCYVCIFSLRTNNWKVLEYFDFVSSRFKRLYIKARLVNGTAYIFEDFMKDGCRITSFDLSCEIFREIKLPEERRYSDYYIMEEYRGSLAFIGRLSRDFEDIVVMWILRVSDDNLFSWDKMSVIKLKKCWDFKPMGFINKDELVMWNATKGFLYNVENERRRKFSTGETAVAMVQSSRRFKCFISVGVVAQRGNFNELRIYKMELITSHDRQPKMEEVALNPTGYKHHVLADSDSDNGLLNDLFE